MEFDGQKVNLSASFRFALSPTAHTSNFAFSTCTTHGTDRPLSCSHNHITMTQASADASQETIFAADTPALYTEQGRAERKRMELRKKLVAKKVAEGAVEITPKADPAETEKLVSEVVKDIEDKEGGPKLEKPKNKVNVAGKMLISTEQELDHKEAMRMQSKVGVGKCSNMKVMHSLQGVTETLTEANLTNEQAIMISGCEKCEINVESTCVKIFVEKCKDLVLRVRGKVITQTIEVDHSSQLNILLYSKVGTLQVEQCQKVNCLVESKELFNGYMIWAGCALLRLQVGDDLMRCDFGLTQQLDPTINIERTQFKVWYNSAGKLICDKVIRLKNGFPTTKREDDEHVRREEQKLEELGRRIGITLHRKDEAGNKLKPNEKCACGSGKKYKKCCMTGQVGLVAEKITKAAEHAQAVDKLSGGGF